LHCWSGYALAYAVDDDECHERERGGNKPFPPPGTSVMDAHFYALHHSREAIVGDGTHPGRQMAQRLEDCLRRMRGLVGADAHSGQGWLTKGNGTEAIAYSRRM